MTTNIYFIRHAKTIYKPEDYDFNRPLSQSGKKDSFKLVNKFDDINIDKIYSSPYIRAINTIKNIAIEKCLDIELLYDLRERKVSSEYINNFEEFSNKQWNDFEFSLDGGESLLEVQKRGIRTIEKILNINKSENIIVGCHGTWLGVVLNYFDKSYDYQFWKTIKMPDVFLFKFEENNLKSINNI